jgi:hypothetical protein
MKLSYAITVKDELAEIQRLVPFLLSKKRPQDEIVILYDQKNGNEEVANYLKPFNIKPNVQFWRGYFDNHFADWKNKLTEYCSGDHIFAIDADEMPHENLIDNLPAIIESNPEIDVIIVPRINTVEGITQEHITKWGWRVDNLQSPNLIEEKEMDTESEEYKLLKEGGFIIEEHSVSI